MPSAVHSARPGLPAAMAYGLCDCAMQSVLTCCTHSKAGGVFWGGSSFGSLATHHMKI